MISEIPDLWPAEVAVTSVLSPLAILRYQAGQLRYKTKNILEAEVRSEKFAEVPDFPDAGDEPVQKVRHFLDVIAPALERYRVRLITLEHRIELVYPVHVIDAEGHRAKAQDQDDFVTELAKALQSPETIAVLHSLAAQTNDLATLVEGSSDSSNRSPAAAKGPGRPPEGKAREARPDHRGSRRGSE